MLLTLRSLFLESTKRLEVLRLPVDGVFLNMFHNQIVFLGEFPQTIINVCLHIRITIRHSVDVTTYGHKCFVELFDVFFDLLKAVLVCFETEMLGGIVELFKDLLFKFTY